MKINPVNLFIGALNHFLLKGRLVDTGRSLSFNRNKKMLRVILMKKRKKLIYVNI